MFAAEQSSYLVGIAAAMQAKAAGGDTVGFVGGMDSELIQTFRQDMNKVLNLLIKI